LKIHRLLGIVMYLLNHELASSRLLAEKFEVSRRTIQRDIDAISLAGIPIISIQGSRGGYGVIEGYKIDRQLTNSDDYIFIITALKGLYSAFHNKKISDTLDKLLSLSPKQIETKQTIFLDFSVLGEKADIVNNIKLIEGAIKDEKPVNFDYTDAENNKTHRIVEPLAIRYRWYAWYLFGYCCTRKAYRMFKLPRITNLHIIDRPFSQEHRDIEELMENHDKHDNQHFLDIKLLCKAEIRTAILEYLFGHIATELENGDFILEFHTPEYEQIWSVLLGFGDKITVLEPPELRQKLFDTAVKITRLYTVNDDR
jgi:predicted DNA-binding transcriptional regulator YafY